MKTTNEIDPSNESGHERESIKPSSNIGNTPPSTTNKIPLIQSKSLIDDNRVSSINENESKIQHKDKMIKRYKSQLSSNPSNQSTSMKKYRRCESQRSISFALQHRPSLFDSKLLSIDASADHPDSIPSYMTFTYIDILTLTFSICTYFIDFITDIIVTIFHYTNNDFWYCYLTIAFIVLPTLIMTIMSLRWYILDSKDPNSLPVSKWQWILRVIFLTLQLGPIMRYIDSILYGLKFRKLNEEKQKAARRYFQYMIYEDTDATMLRLFECFMEAAPQLVLQLTIMIIKMPDKDRDWTVFVQSISIVASLVSLSWCLVTYLRILRMSLACKHNMTWPGTIVQFLWRFFMIGSRVLALALFASEYPYYIGVVCGIHWLIMFIWIITLKTSFCVNRLEELFYNAILAVIFIFCYFNPVDGHSRKRYLFYYSVMFVENLIILILWYNRCDQTKHYRSFGIVVYLCSFVVAIIFMLIYYLKLHPTQNIHIFTKDNDVCEPPVTPTTPSMTAAKTQTTQTTTDTTLNAQSSSPSSSSLMSSESTASPFRSAVASVEPKKNHSKIIFDTKLSKTSTIKCDENNSNSLSKTTKSKPKNYKRQFSDVWTTNGRLLHPRPAMPPV